MTQAIRRALVPATFLFVLALIVSGCSSTSSETAAVGTSGPAVIGVKILPGGFVTVENHAGLPLLDMEVAVKPVGRLSSYSLTIPRMESGSKRDLSLGDLREPGGGRINPNLVRLKDLVVTARDLDGNKYEVSVPWTQ